MPQVVPQLKTITAGGAVAGVGIEATSFRHGLVHDTLLEADVLLASGEVVTCTPDNEHRELFLGLPNSYGTLGYALRLRLRTQPVRPFVQVEHLRFSTPRAFFAALQQACDGERRFRRRRGVRPRRPGAQRGALRRRRAGAQRLQLRAHLLPLAARQADRLPDHGRLPLALGHRLVLVLEERRRAAPAGAPPARAAAAELAHLHPADALERALGPDAPARPLARPAHANR